jgi:repressor LexA
MAGLTERQAEFVAFIRSHKADKGYAPTADEIASHFGIAARSAVQKQLDAIERKGFIRRARTIGGRVIPRVISVVG